MPASLRHPVGTGYWVLFLFAFAYTPISIFMPLVAQRLHDVPPSLAGYVGATMSFGWTAAAVVSSGAGPRLQRILIVTGPVCLLAGIVGQSYFVAEGPIGALVLFLFVAGLGMGQSYAHLSNRLMIRARSGEEAVTAGAIPTMQSLGLAFGAATGGLLANAAGLGDGITTATMTAVTEWIYGFCLFPAAFVLLSSLRFVWLLRETDS
jgi:hypothetical protein